MFVDTFTVQYIRKLRSQKNGTEDEEDMESSRITPIISILAGVILLICSGILIMAKSGRMNAPHIKIPTVKVKMPNVRMPKVKMPKFPSLPKIHFALRGTNSGPPTDAIVAGKYVMKQLYHVEGISCGDGRPVELWQDGAGADTTVFGSVHGGGVVGRMSYNPMWKKGSSYFTIATYNGNERGIVEIDPTTAIVRRINPGDGCLLEMTCVNLDGKWMKNSAASVGGGVCSREIFTVKQTDCRLTVDGNSGDLAIDGNTVIDTRMGSTTALADDSNVIGMIISQQGVIQFHDKDGCVFEKMTGRVAMEGGQ